MSDGQWHHITFKFQNRTAYVYIDDYRGRANSAQIKLPKLINLANSLSIGGLPENRSTLSKQILLLDKMEFKGCIRKLLVNNSTQDLARPGFHRNIGQCFPRVENGSFFSGDAYAIYSRAFDISKHLHLKLEFKTSELNGILMNIAETSGTAALTIEMFNGNIVMACYFGNGNPFFVQTSFSSKFELCDNKWHTVSASYNHDKIALKIDNQPDLITSLQNVTTFKMHMQLPLYIGGVPGNNYYYLIFLYTY